MNRDALERAVALSHQGYELMQWIGEAVARGTVGFTRAHGTMSMPAAARDWVARNYDSLPARVRPERADLTAFANLASTYLETSFELKAPGRTRLASSCGCDCPWCTTLVAMPTLTPKRLGARDKERAQALVRAVLVRRAEDVGATLDDEAIARILEPAAQREAVAMVAWAHELLRRLDGYVTGPAVLALWRMFAWKPTGSPKPGFELRASDLIAADELVDSLVEGELVREDGGADGLRVELGRPEAGWMRVELQAGDARLVLDASYVIDPIEPLVRAGLQALEGLPIDGVVFFEEPAMHRLTARDDADALVVLVRAGERGDGAEELTATTTRRGFAEAIWRGLRRLEGAYGLAAITAGWSARYPVQLIADLGARLRATRA